MRVQGVAVAGGEGGVVGEDCAGADDDRVSLRATAMDVSARSGPRDPLARAVRGCGASVEALRPFHGDVRATEAQGGQPSADERARGIRLLTGLDADSRIAEPLGASTGDGSRVVEREDDAGDTGLDECDGARAGAAGVVAGLEGDDRGRAACGTGGELGEGVDLGVRSPGTTMPSFGEDVAGGGEDDGADLRVHAARAEGCEFERTTHRPALRLVHCHPLSFSEGSGGGRRRAGASCCLPSGLARDSLASPSVPEFHRVNASVSLGARGLSPPVRILTDPGARCCSECSQRV